MKKICSIPSLIFICMIALFVACDGNKTNSEQTKQNKINPDSQQVASELNKYLITPPDTNYTGDYIDKYSNGVIKFSGFFRFGKRHGQWSAFFENGEMWSECFYDNGLKHGSTKVYFPNGKLKYSGWYKEDKRDSLWLFYDETGKEIDKRAFRDDQETGLVN